MVGCDWWDDLNLPDTVSTKQGKGGVEKEGENKARKAIKSSYAASAMHMSAVSLNSNAAGNAFNN